MSAAAPVDARPSTSPPRVPRARGGRVSIAIVVALVLLVLVCLASVLLGTRSMSPENVFRALFDPTFTANDAVVIRELRGPRTVVGLVAGAALGLAGALMQGVTRNPLADPGLLGVNAGASFAVVLGLTFAGVTTTTGMIPFALGGAGAATVLVYAVSALGRDGATPVRLAVAGAAVTAALTSLTTLVLLGNQATFDRYRFWTVGALVGRSVDDVAALAIPLAIGAVLALALGRSLNGLALGDDLATGLGQNVHVTRVLAGAAILLLCGSSTAIAGPIVFAGLAAPHIARRMVGTDYRALLPLSALLGPLLLLTADVVGRLIGGTTEIEAGVVVCVLGAPLLIALVRRTKAGSL